MIIKDKVKFVVRPGSTNKKSGKTQHEGFGKVFFTDGFMASYHVSLDERIPDNGLVVADVSGQWKEGKDKKDNFLAWQLDDIEKVKSTSLLAELQ